MKKPIHAIDLDECKIQASILLKACRSQNISQQTQAAKRFQNLRDFAKLSVAEILQKDIKHKHALALIAAENGFASWVDLKDHCQKEEETPFDDAVKGGFLNVWFATYSEAKAHHQASGGFLLPYRRQFFVCEDSYIEHIGLEATHEDWQLMGKDWVKPKDIQARHRRYKLWLKLKIR